MEQAGRKAWRDRLGTGRGGREAWHERQDTVRGLLVLVVIVLLSTGLSPHGVPQAFAHQDKLHHLLGFFVFTWTLRKVYPRVDPGMVFAAGAGIALCIELGQALVPTRTVSALDFAAGVAGSLFGSLVAPPWGTVPMDDDGRRNP